MKSVNMANMLSVRSAMAPCATFVCPSELKLSRHPFVDPDFKKAIVMTRINMTKPLNPIPVIGLSARNRSDSTRVLAAKTSESSSVDGSFNNGNHCLDLFLYKDTAEARGMRIEELLPLAWSHNPLTTLKIICRIIQDWSHGSYYSNETFCTVMFWLHRNHPKTLARNMGSIARLFVSFYQFFNLLRAHLVLKEERQLDYRGSRMTVMGIRDDIEGQDVEDQDLKQKVVQRYQSDPDYRFLHKFISDVFAESFKPYIEKLKQSNTNDVDHDEYYWTEITEAAVSCLSMATNFSEPTLLLESIAKKVFPRESCPEYQGVLEEADYSHSIIDRLRKEVLLPLDKACKSQGCPVEKYLARVKADKSNIEADGLLPHYIIGYLNHWNFGQVVELQWKAMVEDIKQRGELNGKKILNNCLALPVCEVDPMFSAGNPEIEVLVGLTLLMSELNEDPWKGKVITFDKSPKLNLIQGDKLRYKCDFFTRMKWDTTKIDFQKVFDLILEEAVNGNLKPEQMVKKVFVFTDTSDFDFTSANSWKTDYEAIQKKFKEKGFVVPQIVYWRLNENEPREWVQPSKHPGVTVVDGFSDYLLTVFLKNGGEIRSEFALEAAVYGKGYKQMVVVD